MRFLYVLFFLLFANIGKCNPLSSVVGQFHWFPFSRFNNLVWLTSKRHRRITFWSMLLPKRNFLFSCYFIIVFRDWLSCIVFDGLVYTFHLLVHVVLHRSMYLTDTLSSWRHRNTCVFKSFCFLHFTYLFVRYFKFYLDCLNYFLDIMWNFISV